MCVTCVKYVYVLCSFYNNYNNFRRFAAMSVWDASNAVTTLNVSRINISVMERTTVGTTVMNPKGATRGSSASTITEGVITYVKRSPSLDGCVNVIKDIN